MDNIIVNSEEALVGACLRDGTQYERAREIVAAGEFGNHALGFAWLAMEHLFEQRLGIDTVTVGDELERMDKMSDFISGQWSGRALLSTLRQSGEPKQVLTYAENVQDTAAKRTMDNFFTKCVYWAKNGRRAKDIMSDVSTELSKISLYGSQDEFTVPISTAASEAYDWTDQAAQGKIVGVPTGFIDLDRILGSMIAGNVYIVAGRPGKGKTALVLSIARNVANRKKRVGIFSLEMSRMQVAQRLIAQEAEVDLHALIQGKLREDEWANYTHGVEVVADLPIVINDLSSINIAQIRQTARKIKAAGGLDLLIVDYIQLASGEGKRYERRDLEVSAVSRGLKYLARELNVPILAAAQLSRAVEQRTHQHPILSDLKESGSLEQDAYAVMFIYEPEEEGKAGFIGLDIAKHRNGPIGVCELVFRSPLAKFENASNKFEPEDYVR